MQPVEPAAPGWMDPRPYPFCDVLEQHSAVIRAELERVIRLRVWTPWREGPYTPTSTDPTAIGDGDEPRWRLFGLYLRGRPIARHCRLCPETARVLSHVPKLTKAGFACLEAGYVMQPHIGHNPHNYRVHLGLVIPEGDCGMRVGGETRRWAPGAVTMFDDNQLHEAWNRTAENRYVLIVDVANRRPEDPATAAALEDAGF